MGNYGERGKRDREKGEGEGGGYREREGGKEERELINQS